MSSLKPSLDTELDLGISMAIFATPGAGMLGADDDGDDDGDDGDKKGPLTVGTTCWGTPCPSANTVSC